MPFWCLSSAQGLKISHTQTWESLDFIFKAAVSLSRGSKSNQERELVWDTDWPRYPVTLETLICIWWLFFFSLIIIVSQITALKSEVKFLSCSFPLPLQTSSGGLCTCLGKLCLSSGNVRQLGVKEHSVIVRPPEMLSSCPQLSSTFIPVAK